MKKNEYEQFLELCLNHNVNLPLICFNLIKKDKADIGSVYIEKHSENKILFVKSFYKPTF